MPPTPNPLDQKTTNPSAHLAPYYESAGKVIDDSKKGMLEAVAKGGQAGSKAYQAQIDAAGLDRQAAVARAAESSALGYGSDPNVALRGYDTRIGLLGDTKASNQSYFDALGAAGSSYFDKAKSGLAASQAMGINRALGDEAEIRGGIQLAQEKAQAELEKEMRAEQRQIDRENRAEGRAISRENRAKAEKGPDISIQGLLGLASQAGKLPAQKLPHLATTEARNQVASDEVTRQLAGQGDTGALSTLAGSIGRLLGVPEMKLAELYAPGQQQKLTTQTAPAKDDVAKSLASKYATKGVTHNTAKSALGGRDFKDSVQWVLGGKNKDGTPITQEQAQEKLYQFYIKGEGRKGGNPGPWVAEYEIMMGEYVPRLPKASDLEE